MFQNWGGRETFIPCLRQALQKTPTPFLETSVRHWVDLLNFCQLFYPIQFSSLHHTKYPLRIQIQLTHTPVTLLNTSTRFHWTVSGSSGVHHKHSSLLNNINFAWFTVGLFFRNNTKWVFNSFHNWLSILQNHKRTNFDFHVLHATIWANSPIYWKSQPFRSLCSHALLITKKNQESIESMDFF